MPVRVDLKEERREPAGRPWGAWLAWAAIALLLCFTFWLLLGACAIRWLHGLPLLYACPALPGAPGASSALGAEIARQRALEAEIERLQLALLGAPACRPRASDVPSTPAPIPEDAWNQRDASFLEGCWELQTDYRVEHVETHEIRQARSWEACFDADGKGRQTLTFDDGTECTGPMLGQFGADGRLQLDDTGDLPCADGFQIFERHTSCERVDALHARCDQHQPRTDWRGDVIFRHRAEAAQ